MKYLKLALLVGVICLMSHFYSGDRVFSQSSQPSVQLLTEPALEQIRPLAEKSVQFTLKALDKTGKALNNANIHLTLLTPPRSPWFSTDFPWVEGTTLLDISKPSKTGELQFQQILPIRGNYTFKLEVNPLIADTFQPFQQTLSLSVSENEIKYRNYVILLVLLLFVGFGGGWIIGAGESLQTGEVVPQRVRLLLSSAIIVTIATLLFICITAEVGSSHSEHENHQSEISDTLNDQGEITDSIIQLLGEENATVGQLNNFQIKAINTQTQKPLSNLPLTIKTNQLESNLVIFATQAETDSQGQFRWQQQFFDGSPHELNVTISPNISSKSQPLQIGKAIEVEAIHPPLVTRLISLGYMLFTLTIAFGLGFWLHHLRPVSTMKR
jgi:hypothetical protein